MHFEIYRQGGNSLASSLLIGGDWRWRLRGANGEIIAHGESYTTKESCLHAINLIKGTNATTPVQMV